jgi:hypothetical protein
LNHIELYLLEEKEILQELFVEEQDQRPSQTYVRHRLLVHIFLPGLLFYLD